MKAFVILLLMGLTCVSAQSASSTHAALGTSAAVDSNGRLWIAYAEQQGESANVLLRRSDDEGATWQQAVRVTAKPEPVAADGENRPKIAFGPGTEIYVSWTSPTSAAFTGDIRFARSLDAGKHWSAPQVLHRDRQVITHRFESMLVDGAGRIWVAWIDKRDLKQAEAEKRDYAGAAIYYAYSDDRGASWRGDFKLADHTCECCRIALTKDANGRAAALWRHVFPPNERDHAYAVLDPRSSAPSIARVTFDRWRIDACPHHGPSLAYASDGTRHAVWFNQVDGQGRAFYGRLGESGPDNVQPLPAGASHADLAVSGNTIAVVWKRFDGAATKVESWFSMDGGGRFSAGPTLQTSSDSDQPRVLNVKDKILLAWRRADGVVVRSLTDTSKRATPLSQRHAETARAAPTAAIGPFGRDTLASIERRYSGQPFWLVLWDLECVYCMKSLRNLAEAQRAHPGLKVVTITTDSISAAKQIDARLAQLGVASEPYAFSDAPREALQFAVDPTWLGEKPRAYRYAADGKRQAVSGVITAEQFAER